MGQPAAHSATGDRNSQKNSQRIGINRPIPRRRFLSIVAATAGFALPFPGAAAMPGAPPPLHRWRGRALGAEALILLAHPDRLAARALLRACVAEVGRLERIFSLYLPDSAVSRLNAQGRLLDPPVELVCLLDACHRFGAATGGAFDPSVGPLWRLYADHFTRPGADPAGPDEGAIERALGLVDSTAIEVGRRHVALARPGMAVTLNGIAQGHITDRVTELLRDGGITDVLVNLGEYRALGAHPEGRPWRVGLADPAAPDNPARIFHTVDLEGGALATSGGYGTPFDAPPFNGRARHHHLFDPRSGRSSHRCLSVSVTACRAQTADALSTALAITGPEGAADILQAAGGGSAIFKLADGSVVRRRARAAEHAIFQPRKGKDS
jgi:thiamine biosynthesis lipoprotein